MCRPIVGGHGGAELLFQTLDVALLVILHLDLITVTGALASVSSSMPELVSAVLKKSWWLFAAARELEWQPCSCTHLCARRLFLLQSYVLDHGLFSLRPTLLPTTGVQERWARQLATARYYLPEFNAVSWLFRGVASRVVSIFIRVPLASPRMYFAVVLSDTATAWPVVAWSLTGLANLVSPQTLACSFSTRRPISFTAADGRSLNLPLLH